MAVQRALLLVFAHVILGYAKPQPYQNIFLRSINPIYNTIYGDGIIDNHVYNSLAGRIFPQVPGLQSDFNTAPQSGPPIGVAAINKGENPLRSLTPGLVGRGFPQLPQPQPPQDSATLTCGQTPRFCPKSRYRSYDGSCNNLRNPGLGTPQTRYNRLLPAKYGDGISTPTVALSGNSLPSARTVSVSVYPDVPIENPIYTLNAMQYGQFIAHDMSLLANGTQIQPGFAPCCSADGQLPELANSPEYCFPIIVPANDPAYSQHKIRCMNFVRTVTDRDRGCTGGHQPAEQLTDVNHFLDLSTVYGNTDQINQQVRSFQGGRLITEQRNNQEWMPRSSNVSIGCTLLDPNEPCYMAGDFRVNQNPQLTVLHTLLLREHNRLANNLAKINPHWDDETIFQEARKLNIGQHQQISYYEWLPIFIGLDNSLKNKILWRTKGFVNDYDPNVNPTVLNEHATAAFRFFHSLVAGQLDLVTEERTSYCNIRLSDWVHRPAILEHGNSFDELIRGLATQPEFAADAYHDREITQHWLRHPEKKMGLGLDLKAVCTQRNRDHGLASYNDYRYFCGLPKARSFRDFLDVISKDNVRKLASLYEHPDDVDLTVGGSLEAIVPGTLAGPTFLCILTEQFYRTRVGDRFWFENSGDIGFTLPQLTEIRKASISRIMCDNGMTIRAMQPRGFERISQTNAIVPCGALPVVNLSHWRDLSQIPATGCDSPDCCFKK